MWSLRLRALVSGMVLLGLAPGLAAQQYRSEARGVSEQELKASESGFDAEAALQKVSDPYARSMLLAQIAREEAAAGREAQALKRLEEAVNLNALSGFARQQLLRDAGLLAARLGRDADVIRLLKQAGEVTDPRALRQLAAAYARGGRWSEAQQAVRTLMEAKNPTSDDRVLDATVAAKNRDWARVLTRTAEVLEQQPLNASAWQLRIQAHLQRGRQALALADQRAAWRLQVAIEAEHRLALIGAFAEAGVPLQAASLLEEGLATGQIDDTVERLDQLAALWLAARQYTDARAVLEQRLARAPSAEASLQLGQMALNAGDWDAAARHLRLGLALDSAERRGGVAMLLGQAEFQRGRLPAAREAFARAATIARYRNSARQWVEYLDSGQASAEAVAGTAVAQGQAQRRTGAPLQGLGANRGAARTPVTGFTEVGAERPGSPDGRIPDFRGGLPADTTAAHPYADDAPVAVISAESMRDWEPWLSEGHKALLKANPAFRMPVYPTRRSVQYPQAIREATQKNRGRARLLGSDALTGAQLGFPFPSPDSGVEAMWNHRLRWRGEGMQRTSRQAVVDPRNGAERTLVQYEEMLARYASIADPADLARENILLYYLTTFGDSVIAPDFTVLVHESANSLERARAIWVLTRNFGKMFRIPPVGYDNPFPGSDGLFYVDMVDMYNGAFDRYDWKLGGKRELLIGYNAFAAQGFAADDGDQGLLRPGAVNADALRYEVHRVWVVEASERGGKSHIFGVRRFYLDEDSWNVVLVENYDRAGQLWRVQEGHLLPNPRIQAADAAPVVTYDLQDGRYFIQRMTAEFGPSQSLDGDRSIRDYRPANVKARYAR